MATNEPSPTPTTSAPWWRYGHVWLVISGPAIVVVAGFVTLWLAVRTPDPVVDENYYQAGININKTLAERQRALTPAMQGRNHSMTPAEDLPAAQR
jgi:hypothetical protein